MQQNLSRCAGEVEARSDEGEGDRVTSLYLPHADPVTRRYAPTSPARGAEDTYPCGIRWIASMTDRRTVALVPGTKSIDTVSTIPPNRCAIASAIPSYGARATNRSSTSSEICAAMSFHAPCFDISVSFTPR